MPPNNICLCLRHKNLLSGIEIVIVLCREQKKKQCGAVCLALPADTSVLFNLVACAAQAEELKAVL